MQNYDDEQWQVLQGDQVWRVKNRLCGLQWDVLTPKVKSLFSNLDKEEIQQLLTMKCQCHFYCGSKLTFLQLVQAQYDSLDKNSFIEKQGMLLKGDNEGARQA